MKKFFFVMLAMLVATVASAAQFETKTAYTSIQNTPVQGLTYGIGYAANVFEGTGFVKNVYVGGLADLSFLEGKTYDLFLAPVVKVEIPLIYAKAGFGYDFIRQAGVNTNDWAIFTGAGFQTNLTDTVKVAFDYTLKYNVISKVYSHSFGPAFMFAL